MLVHSLLLALAASTVDAGAVAPLNVTLTPSGVSVNGRALPPFDPAFINDPALDETTLELEASKRHALVQVQDDVTWESFITLAAHLFMTRTTATVDAKGSRWGLETLTSPGNANVTVLTIDANEVTAVSLDQAKTKWKRAQAPPAAFVTGLAGRVVGVRAQPQLRFSDVVATWQRLNCPSCRATLLVGERTWDGPSLAAAVKAPGAGVVSDVVIQKPVPSDKEVIERVITSHLVEVSACYDASRKTEPNNAGKVVIDFVIATSGAVSSATVASQDETLSKSVGPCILAALKTWRWPAREKPKNVRYPFTFATR